MNKLFIGVIVLLIGFCIGFYTKGKFEKADVAEQAQVAAHDTATGIVESVATSQKVEASIQQSDNQVDQIQKAVNNRLEKGVTHARANGANVNGAVRDAVGVAAAEGAGGVGEAIPDCCGRDVLDNGTVRLLNAARTAGELDATSSDAR